MASGTVKWFNPARGFGVRFDLERSQNGKLAAANLRAG